jgi:chromosome segregation ATPase
MMQESISDLQQEAQKFSPLEGTPTIEITATTVNANSEQSLVPLESPVDKKSLQLEATVKELREALDKARQNEVSFQEKIIDLQSALLKQKELSEHLKSEVEEAKNAAIHLAQANSKLTEEISVLKQEKQPVQASAQPAARGTIQPSVKSEQGTIQPSPKPDKGIIQPSIKYRKSYTIPKLPDRPKDESVENTNSQMWLLD